ncbi:DUF885 domain-containing protein [Actinocrispum wychmicini]|uniref:Uncharacterized protein (DUF885 family) n=1 Tax=Actinocrispum wychmicini TaxID=1213861 RepID=A0A4R2IY95_9PSEU|nr:DUF885 domain-containing protein [Actinocrispum wychmicini]TCO50813.1 uncharacterized protein (DUF885 family) [Actinocrispum wychmicini]
MIDQLADELLDVLTRRDPLGDFYGDFPAYADRLPDPDPTAEAALADQARRIAARAAEEPPSATRGVVLHHAQTVLTLVESRLVEHTMWDFQVSALAQLLGTLPVSVGDYPARLAAIPDYLAKCADRHRSGRKPVARRVQAAVARIDAHLADPANDPLRREPENEQVLADVVRPAFARYRDVLAGLDSRADDQPGLCWLPDGESVYASLVRMHTTTEQSSAQLHQIGLDLLAELDGEFARVGGGPAAEVRERSRQARYRSREEVLAIPRAALERAERAAPDWFGRIPERRCAIEETPPDKAPGQSVAYYVPPTATYHANTYRWEERDRSIAEANAFHEAVPGHHFQITLARELTGVPRLTQVAYINAYLEGWSLYCERLADEMGLYSDDIYRLGMLANAGMRAARLVVDTGLHAFGWSRPRVVDFLRANTAMNEVEVQQETDRYIENPGQALSYMAGRLAIDRIRARAEQVLGSAFDIRMFHDVVLGTGPVPMAVLDDVVTEWMGAA